MAESALAGELAVARSTRHAGIVRLTHWVTALCFFALLVSGLEVLVSHPRFYWGEAGNALSKPLFVIPIPASRDTVPTGYGYVLPDQNGWSRALHFQTAWVLVLAGLLYFVFGVVSGHFRRNLFAEGATFYNPLQRLTYLGVVFGLFPLVIWTGLAMSPAVAAAFPYLVSALGGQQSARTIHFFVTVLLVLFLVAHVVKVYQAGFWKLTGRMLWTSSHDAD
jgi:thiosulfate reductase cytochrome b subunit